jgi:serine/threonine-protein kinase
MPPPDNLPKRGDLIAGKYQVEEILGQGGMGVVVAARHVALRQLVAVKFLLASGMRMPDASARFLREARAAVAIQSEHVARVLDVGTLENGAPYMVMEHLSGTDFSRLLKQQGPLPIAHAVDFLLQACEAIAEAHSLGIIHRDLKPANLFLTRRADGSPLVKVLDFGLSKSVTEDALDGNLTNSGIVVGSPHCMSPEQIRGLKHIDWRTDIWALGVILYHMLTGRRPFVGDSAAAIYASVFTDAPCPFATHRPDVPDELAEVVFACLQKSPNHRVQTIGDLARRLLPFGPPGSAISVERIVRLAPPTTPLDLAIDTSDLATTISLQEPSEKAIPASVAPASAPTDSPPSTDLTESISAPVQLSAWGTTGPAPRPRPIARIAVLSALAVSGAAALGLLWWSAGASVSPHGSAVESPTLVAAPGTASPAASPAPEVIAPPPPGPAAQPIVAPIASTKAPLAPTGAPARSGKPAPKPLPRPAPSSPVAAPSARPALIGLDNPN